MFLLFDIDIIHRGTSKVISIATTNARDLRNTLPSLTDNDATRVIGKLIAERSKEADVYAIGYELRKNENKVNFVNKIPLVPIYRPITRKLAAQITNKQQKSAVEDEEIEMEDAKDWSVVDIDSSDKKNELTVVEYIDDIYAYYKKDEIAGCVLLNYMEQQFDINERMRGILIDRLIEVHYKFELMEETLYLTMNVIDFWQFSRAHIFLFIELCLVEYEMLRFPPSMFAVAAVFTAQCTLGMSREWNATCEKHSNYDKNQILEFSKLMGSFYQKATVGKLTGMHQKYSTSKYGNAIRCEPASFLSEAWFRDTSSRSAVAVAFPITEIQKMPPKRRNQPAPQPKDPLDEHVSHAELRTAFTTLAQSLAS
ncbi:G2/mitotic-specific cyclin-2 [Capsicum annuum]|nr:G2/mitotic-specific cyclin-2 [Capsicum annuum]